VPRRQRVDRRVQIALALYGGDSELQADRPALGDLVQPRAVVDG
jgi:hypothetical protein